MNFWGYSFTDNLYWVNDKKGVVVVDEQHHRSHLLDTSESVLWRMLINQTDADALIRQFSVILSIPEDQSKEKILSILNKWKKNDLVERRNG